MPRGAIVYDEQLAGSPALEWFGEAHWQAADRLVGEAPGRGRTLFVQADERQWALRHYYRGGIVAQLSSDRYWWAGESRVRSIAEWTMLDELFRLGLPVPRPVAAAYQRYGLWYRADIITTRIDAIQLQEKMLAGGIEQSVWHEVGRTIRDFHKHGVCHADLTIRNVLVGAGGAIHVLDFDRARIRRSGGWRQANLDRLLRSIRKFGEQTGVVATDDDWQALLSGYSADSA